MWSNFPIFPVSAILISVFIRSLEGGKSEMDVISWGTHGLNFGGCNCNCDGKGKVQLMAIQKIVEVPKIKIHDFGKKKVSFRKYLKLLQNFS